MLRPMFELASRKVPSLKDGNVDRAKDILQTAPWSQTAFYRDKDAGKAMCKIPNAFSDAQTSSKGGAIRAVLGALGVTDYWRVHLYNCNDFLPDPPYSAGYLAGVPWVLGDTRNPRNEAPVARHVCTRAELPGADRGRAPAGVGARRPGAQRQPGGPGAAAGAGRLLGAEGAGRRGGIVRAAERRGEQGRLARDPEDGVRRGCPARRCDVHGDQSEGTRPRIDPRSDRPGDAG